MMVELPAHEGTAVRKLFAVRTIRLVEPDRNWTRITLDDGKSVLICKDYDAVKQAIELATK